MRLARPISVLLAAAVLVLVTVGAVAWAGSPDASPTARAGIDADTVDGHHAAFSGDASANRANKVLWATPSGKLNAKSLPIGTLDKRYLSKKADTFLYIPGSELVVNFEETNVADIFYTMTGRAVVRKVGSAGEVDVFLPVQLPAQQSGDWITLVNARVYYQLDSAADKIDHTWIYKLDTTSGGHITLASDSGDRTSTAFTSYVVDCTDAGCALSWPTGGFVTIGLGLTFAGTGNAHDIGIAGVLLRYSYD